MDYYCPECKQEEGYCSEYCPRLAEKVEILTAAGLPVEEGMTITFPGEEPRELELREAVALLWQMYTGQIKGWTKRER